MTFGKIIEGTEHRDAVHIAVAPVTAVERLSPGEHIGFIGEDNETVGGDADALIGIVDPFLTAPIRPGQRFFMLLYPNTVTSLRHEWEHPAFGAKKPNDAKSMSRVWIEAFAAELDQTYNRLMDAARDWVNAEEYTYDNTEAYKDIDPSKWSAFWGHYEIVTGEQVKDHEATFFTCSC